MTSPAVLWYYLAMSLKDTEDKSANFWNNAINFCRESWRETINVINDRGLWKENRKARFQVLCVVVVAGIEVE